MNDEQNKIEYPRNWEYTVIGTNESKMRDAIESLFNDKVPQVFPSNKSKKGKYCSLSFSMTVESEGHRNNMFSLLADTDAIKMVL